MTAMPVGYRNLTAEREVKGPAQKNLGMLTVIRCIPPGGVDRRQIVKAICTPRALPGG